MNANGSNFHLVLTQQDWQSWACDGRSLADVWQASPPSLPGVEWRCDELQLRAEIFAFPAGKSDNPPQLAQRRGVGADRYGNVYWVGDDGLSVWVQSCGDGVSSQFWPVADTAPAPKAGEFAPAAPQTAQPLALAGLAVTEDHYLLVGTQQPAGLLVFDLFGGGAPSLWRWPGQGTLHPWDMAPRPGGGVWLLDRQRRCYWEINRALQLCGASVGAADPQQQAFQLARVHVAAETRYAPADELVSAYALDAGSPLADIDPVAIEALPDGSVLILDRSDPSYSQILRFRGDVQLGQPISLQQLQQMIDAVQSEPLQLLGHDITVAPGQDGALRLLVASASGNQSFEFALTLTADDWQVSPRASFLPMRRFAGKGLLTARGQVYYDFGLQWVPLLAQSRPRYVDQATLLSPNAGMSFDSNLPDCVWHRLVLDAELPPQTRIEIWSRAADDRQTLAVSDWQREPALYRRNGGADLPWLRLPPAGEGQDYGHWELLLQRARGRYLQLKLIISGNGRATPRIRALRAWLPRFSYLQQYLPALYRDDPASASFLDRYLANVEGLFTEIEDRVVDVSTLFDWRSAPPEALDWLAAWFDVGLDPAWENARKRLFIRHLLDVYQYRGTIHGLRMALALALDQCLDESSIQPPGALAENRQRYRIVEKYLTRSTPGVLWGEPLSASSVATVKPGRWTPLDGVAALQQVYRSFLQAKTGVVSSAVFDLQAPSGATQAGWWREFAQAQLGFVPDTGRIGGAWQAWLLQAYDASLGQLNSAHQQSYSSFAAVPLPDGNWRNNDSQRQQDWQQFLRDDAAAQPQAGRLRWLWQQFLQRRYQRCGPLNVQWRSGWQSFEQLIVPESLPPEGAALNDYFQFHSTVLAMQQLAHQFRVLIPTPLDSDASQLQRRLDVARRVVELAKPAHTDFDVAYYWALFRVGEARLGLDTLVDRGARALQLPMLLGQQHVGEGWLMRRGDAPEGARLELNC
jgi:phage tail-like protein